MTSPSVGYFYKPMSSQHLYTISSNMTLLPSYPYDWWISMLINQIILLMRHLRLNEMVWDAWGFYQTVVLYLDALIDGETNLN